MEEVGNLRIRRHVGERIVLKDEDGEEIARVLVASSGQNGGQVTLVVEAPLSVKVSREPS